MRIMVTLDGSQFAEAVIDPVVLLAQEAGAEVYLVQVIDPTGIADTVSGRVGSEETLEEFGVEKPISETPQVVEYLDQAQERMSTDAKDYLHRVGRRFDPVHPEPVVLFGENVDEELIKFARARRVDMIALTTHGRSGIAEVILGSHARHLMESGVAPILTVRPREMRGH